MKNIKKQTITNKKRILIPLLLLSLTLLFCSTTVSAADGDTIYVNGSSGDDSWDGLSAIHIDSTKGPKKSIKNATGTVNTNGTIHIANGQYTGESNTQITIDKNMNIIGESQTGTVINGTNTNWIFQISSGVNVTITNLTLTNAKTTGNGGAINNEGNLTVTNFSFTSNTAVYGGAINYGGAIYNTGIISLSNCTFTNNIVASGHGGAICNWGTITSLNGCNFTNNTAAGGGAICNKGTITSLNGCNFTKNRGLIEGGAILNDGGIISSLSGCNFTNNRADNQRRYGGGAIANGGNITILSGCTFTNNTAAYSGGAIFNFGSSSFGTIAVSGCTFTNNTATAGGAIYNGDIGFLGTITVSGCTFTNNTASNAGNAIARYSGSVNADYNWWGSNNPTWNNLLYGFTSNPNYWVILSVNATPNTIYNTQTSVITADFNHYTDSRDNRGILTDHIPDGAQVIFSLTNGPFGSFNGLTSPVTLFTSGGLASISFNAASTGIQNIEAATDDEKVTASITINEPASTGDFVWNDIDKDGIQDAGEPGLAGVTVNLYNSTGEITATTTTDANGHYLFNNIIPGTYSLGFVLPTGYLFSSQDQGGDDALDSDADVITGKTTTTTLLSGENDLTWDAGIYRIVPVANPDSKSVDEDNTITDSVAGNDTSGNGLNTWILVSGPAHGTLDFKSDGSFTYTPNPNYHGPDSFTYYITDGDLDTSATVTVSITVNSINDVPVAVDDTAITDEDTPLTGGNVAGNDIPSGDGGNIWSVVSGPDHGTLVMNADGTYTYTPYANYNGPDQFTYKVTDVNGDFSTAKMTITVTPVNDAPTVGNYSITTQEDTSTSGQVAGNDADSTLTYSVTKNPSHGTITSFNPNTGTWTYMPNKDYNGDDSFEVTVSDGIATAISTVTIHVTAVNDVPVTSDNSQTIDEDTTATGKVTATDADGDSLTYTKATNPAHGTVTVNSDGTWTYAPTANWHGTDSFTVLVNDGNDGTTTSTISITVNSVNDIPLAQNDTATTKEDKPININVLGNDSDADGDSLTVTSVTQPNHGTATINADGTVTYTPNNNWYGLDSFTYTISDCNGGTATATVTITVNQTVSDLYIKTTSSNSNPNVGETFKITYKLGNNGPDAAENVTITFQLPESLDFVNISVDSGKCSYNETTRTVTWTLDSVPVGDPYLYLTVKAADDGTYKITPNVTSDTYNSNTGDDGIITFNIQAKNSNSGNGTGTNTVNAASKTTIGLQKTGLPLNYLILAILLVLGSLVPRRK